MPDDLDPRDDEEMEEEQPRQRPGRRPAPAPLVEERTRGVPFGRPIAIAAAVVLAAAAFLFWPHGGPEAPGIGERYTVVEAGAEGMQGTTSVRSGDVDIASEISPVTPESGRRTPATSQTVAEPPAQTTTQKPAPPPAASAPARTVAKPPATRPAAVAPARQTTAERPAAEAAEPDRPVIEPPIGDTEAQVEPPTVRASTAEHEVINLGVRPAASEPAATPAAGPSAAAPAPAKPAGPQPTAAGSWAVQAGAFGTAANAEEKMAALRQDGFAPFLKAGNTADGRMVYRVWIGWFATREQAADYAARHRPRLGDTLVQHR